MASAGAQAFLHPRTNGELDPVNARRRTQRLLVVDETPFGRELVAALGRVPGIIVAGQARSAEECGRETARLQPDAVLLDLHTAGAAAVAALAAVREACPGARVLLLTMSEDAADLAAALRAGADGYLVKNIDAALLVSGIRRALNGEPILGRRAAGPLEEGVRLPAAGSQRRGKPPVGRRALSPREREIIRLLAQGQSNKEIGKVLGVAESTVKIHVRHILQKLKLSSRVQAAVYASEHGMLAGKRR
jgi:two-component system nitrate/nitrite response regulator NarL